MNGNILNVIKNMYSNIKSCVMFNQQISDIFVCNMVVKQGKNVSLLLFYINDTQVKC